MSDSTFRLQQFMFITQLLIGCFIFLCIPITVSISPDKCIGINDEDQSDECRICFSDFYGTFAGTFEYFAYNTITESIIYKNTLHNYYLYPADKSISGDEWGYIIGTNYNISSDIMKQPSVYAACYIQPSITKHIQIQDCLGWKNHTNIYWIYFVDIGCNGCYYSCSGSGICIDSSMLCDGNTDCVYNDDESECSVCIESGNDNFSYLSGSYSYHNFNIEYNGSIYYDGSEILLYPSIYNNGSMAHYYYNFIYAYPPFNIIAFCYIGSSVITSPYWTIKTGFCNNNAHWYTYLPSEKKEISLNITMEYCSEVTTNNTIKLNTTISSFYSNFIIPTWITLNDTITFYVAPTGIDENDCGIQDRACGTLKYVSLYAKFVAQNIEYIDSIIIIIRGQNRNTIISSNQFLKTNLCFPDLYIQIYKHNQLPFDSITFTFDPNYISSKEDWFPTIPSREPLCHYQASDAFFYVDGTVNTNILNFTVVINNLIIDDWNVNSTKPFLIAGINTNSPSNLNIKYVFNNFSFHNNKIYHDKWLNSNVRTYPALVNAPQIEVYDSTFNNNVFSAHGLSSIFSIYLPEMQLLNLKQTTLIMQRTVVHYLYLYGAASFVDMTQSVNQVNVYTIIANNTINNVELHWRSSIIRINGIHSTSANIIIRDIIFNDASDNIINIYDVKSDICRIENINISTSRMVSSLSDYNKIFLINIMNSYVNISNVTIHYWIANELVHNCKVNLFVSGRCFNGVQSSVSVLPFNFTPGIHYECNIPVLFVNIISENALSIVNIDFIHVYTDINPLSLENVKKTLFEGNQWLCSFDENTPITLAYQYNLTTFDWNDHTVSGYAFITIDGGYLYLDTLKLYGMGSNNIIILQIGNNGYDYVEANNIHQYYEIFDPYALNVDIFAANLGEGTMIISNSRLYGAVDYHLLFLFGNNYIINSVMEYTAVSIWTSYNVESIYVIDCDFVNVGFEYVRSLSAMESVQLLIKENINYAYHSALIFGAQYVWIQNCYFKTDNVAGIAIFAPSYPSLHDIFDLKSTVMLINNTIERNNDDFCYNVSIEYPLQMWKGVINIVGAVEMSIIYNTMIDTMENKKSLFYINSDQTVCFNGNVFEGSTIIDVDSGFITSCYRNNMRNIYSNRNDCFYVSLGKEPCISDLEQMSFCFVDEDPMDHWTAINPNSSIIKTTSGVSLMLQNITFNTNFEPKNEASYSVIDMNDGIFVFMDTILSKPLISFKYDVSNCDIVCYDILQNYASEQYISQLHIKCNHNSTDNNANDLLSTSKSSFINHTTPYYIFFEYNKTYIVDSYLRIDFCITDPFENRINYYPSLVSIQFINKELHLNDIEAVYDTNIINLKIPVTDANAYENITIDAIANNGELIVANKIGIEITVIPKYETVKVMNYDLLYLLFLLIIPCLIIMLIYVKHRKKYMDVFVVKKTLVLIVGISQFDDKKKFLAGVKRNVDDLMKLWKCIYNYQVYVCNEDTLYCKKRDIIAFVDKHKVKLHETKYDAAMVHIISHGNGTDTFITSDNKLMKTDFFQHEFQTEAAKNGMLIKITFYHGCRGNIDYHTHFSANKMIQIREEKNDCNELNETINVEQESVIEMVELKPIFNVIIANDCGENSLLQKDSKDKPLLKETKLRGDNSDNIMDRNDIALESNSIMICGTLPERSISDSGNFTDCIFKAFRNNAKRRIKKNLMVLVSEIGVDLERRSNNAEIASSTLTPFHKPVRFEKYT